MLSRDVMGAGTQVACEVGPGVNRRRSAGHPRQSGVSKPQLSLSSSDLVMREFELVIIAKQYFRICNPGYLTFLSLSDFRVDIALR